MTCALIGGGVAILVLLLLAAALLWMPLGHHGDLDDLDERGNTP